MEIQPLIIGSGTSGNAFFQALALVGPRQPRANVLRPIWVDRERELISYRSEIGSALPLVCVANPHGLHRERLEQCRAADFFHVVCEKPVCVSLEDVAALKKWKGEMAVCHGYRMNWGPHCKLLQDLDGPGNRAGALASDRMLRHSRDRDCLAD